jgi:amino acid transporter
MLLEIDIKKYLVVFILGALLEWFYISKKWPIPNMNRRDRTLVGAAIFVVVAIVTDLVMPLVHLLLF